MTAAAENEQLKLELQVRRWRSIHHVMIMWGAALVLSLSSRPSPSPHLWTTSGAPSLSTHLTAFFLPQAAEARVVGAQQSVPRLVAERWAAAGAERSSWPPAAQVGLLRALTPCLLAMQRKAVHNHSLIIYCFGT